MAIIESHYSIYFSLQVVHKPIQMWLWLAWFFYYLLLYICLISKVSFMSSINLIIKWLCFINRHIMYWSDKQNFQTASKNMVILNHVKMFIFTVLEKKFNNIFVKSVESIVIWQHYLIKNKYSSFFLCTHLISSSFLVLNFIIIIFLV